MDGSAPIQLMNPDGVFLNFIHCCVTYLNVFTQAGDKEVWCPHRYYDTVFPLNISI